MSQVSIIRLIAIISAVLLVIAGSASCESERLNVQNVTAGFLQEAFIAALQNGIANAEPIFTEDPNGILCRRQLEYLLANVDSRRDLFSLFDAWGRLPAGLLYGHLADFGNYDQCVAIRREVFSAGVTQGKYCKAVVPVKTISVRSFPEDYLQPQGRQHVSSIPVNIRVGICIPAVCTPEMAEVILESTLRVTVRVADCQTDDAVPLRTKDIVAITIFSSIALVLLLSTSYDIYTSYLNQHQKALLITFSIVTNARSLFRISTTKNPAVIECINGLRVWSMIWVVYGHSLAYAPFLNITNIVEVFEWRHTFYSLTFQFAPIVVDTFFFVSGFLIAFMGLKEMTKNKGKLNIPLMYFHRIIRILPLFAIVILFTATIYALFGNGPQWTIYKNFTTNPCQTNWWRAMLFIHNYSGTDNICLSYTWYLAIDMQLYILSPIFLYALYKWGHKFLPALAVLCLISAALAYYSFYAYNYREFTLMGTLDRFDNVYIPTHLRYSTWLIGLGCGYGMFVSSGRIIRLSKTTVLIGWSFALATLLACIYAPYNTVQTGYKAEPWIAATYEQFSKIGWALALGWIVFACHNGYGGKVNTFLSYPLWQVFMKLSYAMYLTHVLVLAIVYGNIRVDVAFSNFVVIQQFWVIFGLTFVTSVVVVLAVESPIVALEKLLFTKKKQVISNKPKSVEGGDKYTLSVSVV